MVGEFDLVSAVLLLRDDGAALLQHRDDKPGLRHAGMWTPPGGHSEPGEPPERCARREFLEETAYDCRELHWLIGLDYNHEDGGPVQQLNFFWSPYDGLSPFTCLEGQALKFVRRQDAESFAVPEYLIAAWDLAIQARSRVLHAVPESPRP